MARPGPSIFNQTGLRPPILVTRTEGLVALLLTQRAIGSLPHSVPYKQHTDCRTTLAVRKYHLFMSLRFAFPILLYSSAISKPMVAQQFLAKLPSLNSQPWPSKKVLGITHGIFPPNVCNTAWSSCPSKSSPKSERMLQNHDTSGGSYIHQTFTLQHGTTGRHLWLMRLWSHLPSEQTAKRTTRAPNPGDVPVTLVPRERVQCPSLALVALKWRSFSRLHS